MEINVGKSGQERVLILVKALPHIAKQQSELVCCAGVTEDLQWRRQYPIRFRSLKDDKKFQRWHWITYDWKLPKVDKRMESRQVDEASISLEEEMKERYRPGFLQPLLMSSTSEAEKKGQSLTLIRPESPKFSWKKKMPEVLRSEREEYATAVKQLDLFDTEDTKGRDALEPCPYMFSYKYSTSGQSHDHQCLDWETSATFYNWRKQYGEEKTLVEMKRVFGEEHPVKGVAFVMGTHSRFPKNWLLIGVLRLDVSKQLSLF